MEEGEIKSAMTGPVTRSPNRSLITRRGGVERGDIRSAMRNRHHSSAMRLIITATARATLEEEGEGWGVTG
jgi:hypothetical protein